MEEKRLRINPLDLITVILIVIFAVAVIMSKMGKHPLVKIAGEQRRVEVDVVVKGLPCTDLNCVKPGEKVFIRVKNQPFAYVEVKDVKFYPRQAVVPTGGGNYKLIPSPSEPNTVDILLTLKANAYVQEDGIVLGTKIKVGVPVDLEGRMIDVKGSVAGIRVL